MRPLLSLLMIVKDEAANVERTIASCAGIIDEWCIFDAGSTDGTQDVVRRALAGVTGVLHEGPRISQKYADRIDYAATRNVILDIHEHIVTPSVFTLFLNGDE